ALDERGLMRVWAWGHPNGLGSGTDAGAAEDLARHLCIARRVGARVMRICGGGRRTRPASWTEHKRGLVALLRPPVDEAERGEGGGGCAPRVAARSSDADRGEMNPRLSLAAPAVLHLRPPDMVMCAAEGGYGAIGLRLLPATPDEPAYPTFVGDSPLVREVEQ